MNKKIIKSAIIIFILIFILTIYKLFSNLSTSNEIYINNNVVSVSYIKNGIKMLVYIEDDNFPKIEINNNKYKLSKNSKNIYEVSIDLSNFKNGKYEIKINPNTPLLNNLDELERINRSKIGDKLITFNYDNHYMSFTVENFNYQYDILIDPGHGGVDSGAVTRTITEANINLIQSLYEKERYEDHGLKVLLSRDDDTLGMMMGNEDWNLAKQRGYAIGYYGVTAKIVYSNHHNSNNSAYLSGFELLVSNHLDKEELKTDLKILNEILEIYPSNLINNQIQIYSRDIETGERFDKKLGKVYPYQDYYATIRIPDELFNVKTVTYEGCYMSNPVNLRWYYEEENWKKISEIKIKNYVELLGITYIPV